jgi:branched-chain amino acid transport system ATP-binding protein
VTLLEIVGLHVRYGGVAAVRGIDFSADAGEVSVVLGPNGAGKSSSLRAVTGLVKASGGTVALSGNDISRWAPHRIARAGLTLVPEGRRVFAPLTVEENLLIGGYTNRSAKRRKEILDRAYEMFPVLHERRAGSAGLLSGGEQQMLAFGRALMADPKVILMDEPSMGLSPAMVDFVMGAVAEIAATGIGVLMVEQNAAAALEVATRGVVLERGEIILTGTASELRSHPDVVKAFLGASAVESAAQPVSTDG